MGPPTGEGAEEYGTEWKQGGVVGSREGGTKDEAGGQRTPRAAVTRHLVRASSR
jgi:hypothetical protein